MPNPSDRVERWPETVLWRHRGSFLPNAPGPLGVEEPRESETYIPRAAFLAVQREVERVRQHETETAQVAVRRIRNLEADLAQCYRLTGADPDGDSDSTLAGDAVEEVRRMRGELDATEAALERLQRGPDTLTPDGLQIVLAALYPDATPSKDGCRCDEKVQVLEKSAGTTKPSEDQ